MIQEGTTVTAPLGKRGVVYEYLYESGLWRYRKDGAGEFRKCTTTWSRRAERALQQQAVPAPTQLAMDFSKPVDEPLHDDITPETIIEPIMYREDILGPKPKHRTLQRHHVGDSRYYVIQFEQPDGTWSKPELYPGVTSIGKAVLPRSRHIEEWMCGFGSHKAALKELNKLAAKGTVMHSLFALCMDPNYVIPDFGTSEFDRMLRGLIASQDGIDVDDVFSEWKEFMCKALLGFKQFIYDYNVEVLAVEIVLGQPTEWREGGGKPLYGYFAQVDLICILDWKFKGKWGEKYKQGPRKGQDKETWQTRRVVGIGDFKSGDGDYPDHDFQMALQKPLVQAAFPNLEPKEIVLFNWHPTNYRKSTLAKEAAAENEPEGDEDDETEEMETESKLKFKYRVIDKAKKKRHKDWAFDLLRFWQKHIAGELPKKMVYKGSPNIDTKPSENVEFKDYPTYWEEKVAKARGRGLLDVI